MKNGKIPIQTFQILKPIIIISVVIFVMVILFDSCSQHKNPQECIITINGIKFHTEIADTIQLQEKGLMNRKYLAPKHGMLFVYRYDGKRAFWMKNTQIPLSIAFISSDGIIKEIYDMEPFSSAIINSRSSVRYALEVNQGEFIKNGIKTGDKIILPSKFN